MEARECSNCTIALACGSWTEGRGISWLSAARRWVATVALGHFAVDFTAQLPTMMYPYLIQRFELSNFLVGVIATAWAVTSSISQPPFGYLGDRVGRRWLAAGCIAAMAGLVAAIPLAPSYGLVVALAALAGIVVGGFHPQGGSIANEAAARNKGASVSTFFLGGHLGFAAAPLTAGVVLAASGLAGAPWLALPALLVAALLPLGLRGAGTAAAAARAAARTTRAAPAAVGSAVAALLVAAVVRGWAYASLNVFTPLFVSPDTPNPTLYGALLTTYLGFHAAGAFSGGLLADRVGARRIIGASSVLLAPCVAVYALAPVGWASFVFLGAAGALIGAGFTPTVLLMQRLMRHRMGLGTGIVLGVSFGAAAPGNMLTGWVGDAAGLHVAFLLLAAAQAAVLIALRWIPAGRQPVDA